MTDPDPDKYFSERLAEIYAEFAKKQIPPDPEFDAVWDDNIEDIYEE